MTVTLADSVLQDARHQLHVALDMGIGKKGLVIAKSVSGIVSRLADSTFLKEHGFERMGYLAPQGADMAECPSVTYLARPDPETIRQIADHVTSMEAGSGSATHSEVSDKRFYLFCIPAATLLCRQILEDRGILANVEVHDLEIDFVPLESDLLSMEIPSLSRLLVSRDVTPLRQLAHGLIALESSLGAVASVRGRGPLAQAFVDVYSQVAANHNQPRPASSSTSLILLDRTVDLVTPLMTPMTYASLIETFRDVQCGFVDVEAQGTGTAGGGRTRKFKLSRDEDAVYAQLADLNFATVGPTLQKLAVSLKAQADERHTADTISAINKFVDKLPEIQKMQEALPIHIGLAESISASVDEDFNRVLEAEQSLVSDGSLDPDFIEELILRSYDLHVVFALICLACLTGSVKEKQLEGWQREMILSYGNHAYLVWTRLEAAGILRAAARPRGSWAAVRESLHLVVPEVPVVDPTDAAYTFSGYAPLSVRVVEEYLGAGRASSAAAGGAGSNVSNMAAAMLPGFGASPKSSTDDPLLRLLPGPLIELGPQPPAGAPVLVAFLGGVTMAEVSALRLLAKQTRRSITVLATDVVSAKRLVNSFAP
ncbi:Vacuolar protein-sorting-associated protein 33 [Blastocladiella emersonii ATCC 22665]|nr:Vacuolar protein-sorting-associated protein 33 [Blastocladiella emersonii ATCC 22665]